MSGQVDSGSPVRGAGRGGRASQGRILLIDDEPLVLRVLFRILEGVGDDLLAISRASDLAAQLEDPDLAVVLLDLMMSPVGGLELLAKIKGQRPDVAVIVMTGRASIESAVQCMRQGATDYIAKPFDDLVRLRAMVRRALERGRLGLAQGAPAAAPRPEEACPAPTPTGREGGGDATRPSLEAYEKLALEHALRDSDGDPLRAARLLGIGRSTLYRKLSKHGITPRPAPAPALRPVTRGSRPHSMP